MIYDLGLLDLLFLKNRIICVSFFSSGVECFLVRLSQGIVIFKTLYKVRIGNEWSAKRNKITETFFQIFSGNNGHDTFQEPFYKGRIVMLKSKTSAVAAVF